MNVHEGKCIMLCGHILIKYTAGNAAFYLSFVVS